MNIRSAYQEAVVKLEDSGVPEAGLDAWYLLEYTTGISRAAFYAYPEKELTKTEYERYREYISRRQSRKPLQHITGFQEFMGLKFHVSRDVLIPRQDTEILVEQAVEVIKRWDAPVENGGFRLLDLCTGSGCILLSVLHYMRNNCLSGERNFKIWGTGADISGRALEIARKNAVELGIDADFVQGDLFENLSGRFDMILSNPPYIPTGEIEYLQEEVKTYDPWSALDGREDGLYFYRKIALECGRFLKNGGMVIFEIGSSQAEDVSRILAGAGFEDIRVRKDFAGLDRTVSAVRKKLLSI